MSSATELMKGVNALYGKNILIDAYDLCDRWHKLCFKPHYDKQRYMSEFDNVMRSFVEAGWDPLQEMKIGMFLHRMVGANNTNLPLYNFYSSISLASPEL